uniref:DUF4216 domain-containing protein n=1 Tax=Solanum lycopersicum TaxID=4081 RepID=A0A3Q7GIC9_SOLLC
MNEKGKTKDTTKTQLDLQEINIRLEFHPIKKGEKIKVPTACYTLSPEDMNKLCLLLKNVKVPNGFSWNISQCVNLKDHKISALKTHDSHVLLQHLLPLAFRGKLTFYLRTYGSLQFCRESAQTHENARHFSDANGVDNLLNGLKIGTQNYGVVVLGENDEDSDKIDYYEVLIDVIVLKFVMDRRVVLFRCNWFDVYDEVKVVKKDEYDFVSVNPDRFLKRKELFVFADQASQVIYSTDNTNKGFKVMRKTQPRDAYDIVEQINDETEELGSPSQKKRKTTNEVQILIFDSFCKFKMKSLEIENEVGSNTKSTIRYTFVAPGAIGKGCGRGLKSLGEKESTPFKSLLPQSSDLVKKYIKEIETMDPTTIGNGLKQKSGSMSSTVRVSAKYSRISQQEYIYANEHMKTPSKSTKLGSTFSSSQAMQKVKKIVHPREDK